MIELINILAVGVTDDDGEILENGTATFYEAGSTDLLTAYQDFELTDPHPNPATLDEAGRLIAYIDGKFKLVISNSSGTVIRTIDNLGTDDSEISIAVGGSTLAGSGLEVEEDGQLAVSVDDVTIEVGSSGLQVKDTSIDTQHIATGGVTKAKQAAVTIQTSSSDSGTFTTSSTSFVDVTNLSISITTTGRPVLLMLAATTSSYLRVANTSGDTGVAEMKFVRDSTDVINSSFQIQVNSAAAVDLRIPASSLMHIDQPGAGTYTYKVQARVTSASYVFGANDVNLMAVEL